MPVPLTEKQVLAILAASMSIDEFVAALKAYGVTAERRTETPGTVTLRAGGKRCVLRGHGARAAVSREAKLMHLKNLGLTD